MSILDRLTDDQLKEMIGHRDRKISELLEANRVLKEHLVRLKDLADSRSARIHDMSGEISALKKMLLPFLKKEALSVL